MVQLSFGDIPDNQEYKEFVKKFTPKKTTDDCYTPANIYDVVAEYVTGKYGISRDKFVRPFWPGGDYERFDYPDGCCVVDNPPFSIITPICDELYNRHIDFFLFCPYLTAFQTLRRNGNLTVIVSPVGITYENGAEISTCFITNLEKDYIVRADPDLLQKLKDANDANTEKRQLPKYEYPDEIMTITKVGWLAIHGAEFNVPRDECCILSGLDEQKRVGKDIFGCGLLLSEEMTAKRIAVENETKLNNKDNFFKWNLSPSERQMQKMLSKN